MFVDLEGHPISSTSLGGGSPMVLCKWIDFYAPWNHAGGPEASSKMNANLAI